MDESMQEGWNDYIDGIESSDSNYLRYVLYANGIVGLNDVTGSEGLIGTISDKIGQFFKWLWIKIKDFWDWLTNPSYVSIKVEFLTGKEAIKSLTKQYTLKSNAYSLLSEPLSRVIESVDFSKQIDKLEDTIKRMEKLPGHEKIKEAMRLPDINALRNKNKAFINSLESKRNTLKSTSNLEVFGCTLLDLQTDTHDFFVWIKSNGMPFMKGTENETSQQSSLKTLAGKFEEKEQQKVTQTVTSILSSMSFIGVAASGSMNILNSFVGHINGRYYFDKKDK